MKNNNNEHYEITKLHCTLINNKIIYLPSKINNKKYIIYLSINEILLKIFSYYIK